MNKAKSRSALALVASSLLMLTLVGCATTQGSVAGAHQRGPDRGRPVGRVDEHGPDPEFRAALQACAAEQGVTLPEPPAAGAEPDTQQHSDADAKRPDMEAMHACMAGKGFDHPMGPPHDQMHGPMGPGMGPMMAGPGMPPPPRDPKFGEAFKACLTEQGITPPAGKPGDDNAGKQEERKRPDHDKLETCLAGKGIEAPMGPPPGGMPGPMMAGPGMPPPPRDPKFGEAFKACLTEQGIVPPAAKPGDDKERKQEERKRPDHDKLKTCLAGKGIEAPLGPPPGGMPGPMMGGPGMGPMMGGPGMPPPPRDPKFDEAFKVCLAEQGITPPAGKPGDDNAGKNEERKRPDHDKLKTCMAGKGIDEPMGPPPGPMMGPGMGPMMGGPGMPPPRRHDAKFEAAMKFCLAEQGIAPPTGKPGDDTQSNGEHKRPDRDKLGSCMSGKGFDRHHAPPPADDGDKPKE